MELPHNYTIHVYIKKGRESERRREEVDKGKFEVRSCDVPSFVSNDREKSHVV